MIVIGILKLIYRLWTVLIELVKQKLFKFSAS